MTTDDMKAVLKLLDEYLAESLEIETPQKSAFLKALAPMAIEGLDLVVMQSGSAGVAARRLLFEVLGLVGKGQKPPPPSKDPAA